MTLFRPRTSQKKGEGFGRIGRSKGDLKKFRPRLAGDCVTCGFSCVVSPTIIAFRLPMIFRLFGAAQICLTPFVVSAAS